MMKKSTIFVVMLSLISCVPLLADETQSTQTPPASSQVGQSQQIKGVIDNIDHEKKILKIKDEISGQPQECDYSESTMFSKDGKTIAATDLKKGDRVSLTVDSQNIATSINIEAAPSTAETQK